MVAKACHDGVKADHSRLEFEDLVSPQGGP
jgi:hypothetical protein